MTSKEKKIEAITKKIEVLKEKLQKLELMQTHFKTLSGGWFYHSKKDDFQKRLNALYLELEKLENQEG